MKRLILSTLLLSGMFFVFSIQSKNNNAEKRARVGSYIKRACSKTYPSGTYTGIKCITGGLEFCTESNPDCDELVGG